MKKKAFTLIELLVVIAIISIMTAVLLVIVASDRERREIRVSAKIFVAGLRETQNKSLTGTKVGSLRPCDLYFDASSASHEIRMRAYDTTVSGQSCTSGSSEKLISSAIFEDGVTVQITDPAAMSVPHRTRFAIPFGDVDYGGLSSDDDPALQFDLTGSSAAHTYRVCLYRSGRIEPLGFVGSAKCN